MAFIFLSFCLPNQQLHNKNNYTNPSPPYYYLLRYVRSLSFKVPSSEFTEPPAASRFVSSEWQKPEDVAGVITCCFSWWKFLLCLCRSYLNNCTSRSTRPDIDDHQMTNPTFPSNHGSLITNIRKIFSLRFFILSNTLKQQRILHSGLGEVRASLPNGISLQILVIKADFSTTLSLFL